MASTEDELSAASAFEELRSGRDLMDGVIRDLPAPQSHRTSFAFGSCQYPGGFIDRAVAYASYRELAERLSADNSGPRFIVLTGDQVYTDATAGILDPSIRDGRYILPYNRWLQSRAVRTALRQVPSYMLLDDHEIENDWEELNTANPFDVAIDSYSKYQRHSSSMSNQLYFDFVFDMFRFFMLDTRTRREVRDLSNIDTADILDGQDFGDNQLSDLASWIQRPTHDRPKFIVSPSMLLPRHREATRWDHRASALHSDGWDGYPASLHELLVMAVTSDTEHVVFLSGDEHVGCIATITVRYTVNGNDFEKTMYSIHTPGLFTPYTFANSGEADWTPDAGRQITVGGDNFEYTVTYTPFPGEGFAYVNVERTAGAWHLTCQFADGPVHAVF
jgi:phosphodiesterase/alkaline phosphatase D-like protein